MTKKQFVAVASAIRAEYNGGNPQMTVVQRAAYQQGVITSAHAFANVAGDVNPRFDRARFLAACGITA